MKLKSVRAGRRRVLKTLGSAAAASLAMAGPAHAVLLPKAKRSEKVDVVVIGTGMAGLAAALSAKAAGAKKVLVLDKVAESRAGGNSKVAGGSFVVPSTDDAAGRQAYYEDLVKKGQGRGNAELYRVLADNAGDGIAWLKSLGCEFLPMAQAVPYRASQHTAGPAMYFGMPKLLANLRQKFVATGGRIVHETKAAQLIVDDRARVAGVKAIGPDGLVDYFAGAVVIATGGYAGSREIMETFVDAGAGAMMVRGMRSATGDGLLLAHEAGAALVNMSGMTAVHVAAVNTSEPAAGNPTRALPFCIAVNRQGRRFVDESRGYVAVGKATMQQPEQTVALILDEETLKLPGPQASLATFKALNQPVIEASSIEELAKKLDVPADALGKTIADFNAAVADGKAPGAVPPKATLAHKVAAPKLYAFAPLKPGVTLTFGGIAVNPKAQALEADGRPIAGLYAAGECAGGMFYDDYVGGASLTNCLVMGRIAGAQAAAAKA